jgi:hypothetical protein
MWTLMHVNGCGGPCFKRTSQPQLTDPVIAEPCRHLDGSQVSDYDPIVCETCGNGLGLNDLSPEFFTEDVEGN